MKKYHGILTALLSFGTAFTAGPLPAKTPKALPLQYTIQDIHGSVLIRDKKTGKTSRAQEEETLRAGDEVMTQSHATASLSLNPKTLVHLSENSKIKIDRLTPKPSGIGFISRLKLLTGKILSEVQQLRESQSSFEIASGGVVCAVRGTAFEVEKTNQIVQTNAFHGVVEVQKGGQVKSVGANQNQDFAFDQDTFLPTRTLTQAERETYQNWLKQKAVVERKLLERQTVLNSISSLSEDDQAELLSRLDAVPEKDRLKKMRQLLQDWGKESRTKILEKTRDDAAQKRKANDSLRTSH